MKYVQPKEEEKVEEGFDKVKGQTKIFNKLEVMTILLEQYTGGSKMMDKVKELSPFSKQIPLKLPEYYSLVE